MTDSIRFMPKKEKIASEQDFTIDLHTRSWNAAPFIHYHDYYEIIVYLGKYPIEFIYENETYEIYRGDIVRIAMFKPHTFNTKINESFERFSIALDPSAIFGFSNAHESLFDLFDLNNDTYPVFHPDIFTISKYLGLISEFHDLNLQYDGSLMMQRLIISKLLVQLYNDCCRNHVVSAAGSRKTQAVSRIIHYINTHLSQPISSDCIAAETGYSKPYISRMFKEETGRNLVEYIQLKRISLAKQLLDQQTGIAEVASAVGFENYSHFYNTFHKLEGISPAEYLKAKKEAH